MKDNYSYEHAVNSASKHMLLHQYTTFEALKKIISNRSLLLRRVDKLNDTVENSHMAEMWKEKVFVSCFTYRNHESYFFWQTYAKGNSEGVMFSLRNLDMQSFSIHPDATCEKEQLDKCEKTNNGIAFSATIDAGSWGIYDYSLVDITYCPRNVSFGAEKHFQGRIKYHEWDMEQETRLRVALRPKGKEYQFKEGRQDFYRPGDEFVYARLTQKCLESMVITLSPYADKTLRSKVEKLLLDNGLQDKVQIRDSVLTGEAVISSTHQSNS